MTNGDSNNDVQRQIDEMKKRFAEKAKGVHTALYKNVARACLLVETTAKRKMTETETNPDVSYGKREHHPSLEGHAPAVDFGTLRMSVSHDVEDDGDRVVGRVGSTITDPNYPKMLEDGTSRMRPRPWLLPSIDENREKIREAIGASVSGREVSVNAGD